MIRFLVGLILGGAVGALGLGAAAVMNPLPDGPISRMPAPEMTPEAPAAPAVTGSAPEAAPAPAPEPVAAPAPEAAPTAPTDTASAPVAPATGDGPAIGAPATLGAPSAPSLGGASDSGLALNSSGGDSSPVRTASAPQVATSAPTDAPAVNTESASVPEVGGVVGDTSAVELVPGQALTANSVPFDGDTSKPLMAIILIDEGGVGQLRDGLSGLTAPISFGVSASLPDATAIAEQYRGAGFEVVAVIPGDGALGLTENLPDEAVQPLLARVVQAVPNATAVLDPIGGPLPNDRAMAETLLDGLRITGHGLLTHRGSSLNTVPLVADEKGVFSEVIYRVIDAEPGSANIALSLERAVLDATRGGSVIVVGHVRQETVTTLFSWLLGSGPREVTIAPVSAVLQ